MNESKTNNDNVNCNKGFMTNKGNYANTPEYFKSRALTNSLPKLYNEGDDITERNVFTNCEMTKKELCKIQMKHAHTLEHAKQTRGELNNQWDELEQKEQEFKDSFIYFDNFVNENEMKRIRAHSKLVEMAALTEKRNHDIHYLQHNIRDCEQIKAQMDNTIAELRIFEVIQILLEKIFLCLCHNHRTILSASSEYLKNSGVTITPEINLSDVAPFLNAKKFNQRNFNNSLR